MEYEDIKFNCHAQSGKTHASPHNMNERLNIKQKQLEDIFKNTGEVFVRFDRSSTGQLCVVYKESIFENAKEKCVRIDSILKNRKFNGYKNNKLDQINQIKQHAQLLNVEIIRWAYNRFNDPCVSYRCLKYNTYNNKLIPFNDFLKQDSCNCDRCKYDNWINKYKSKVLLKAEELNLEIIDVFREDRELMVKYKCKTHKYSIEKVSPFYSYINKMDCGCLMVEKEYDNILKHAKKINCDIIRIDGSDIVFQCNKHADAEEKIKSYQYFMLLRTCGCKEEICKKRSDVNITYTNKHIYEQAKKLGVECVEILNVRQKDGSNKRKLRYKCNQHNDCRIKTCTITQFMRQKTCGCLGIRTVKSKGESIIHHFLLKHNIAVQFQKRFEDCKNVIPLPFDFYLPDYNMCIEFNGRQHYNWKDYVFSNSISNEERKILFEEQKRRDNIKKKYCEDNGIRLLIIPYWDLDRVYDILKEELGLN